MKGKQQANYFSTKADDKDLVELGQFIRDTRPFRIEREWHILFEKKSGGFMGYYKSISKNPLYKSRNPDLIVIDKKTKQLLLVIEVDGDIHRIKETDTVERNEQYKKAGIPMLVISTWEIKTTLIDHVNKELDKIFGE